MIGNVYTGSTLTISIVAHKSTDESNKMGKSDLEDMIKIMEEHGYSVEKIETSVHHHIDQFKTMTGNYSVNFAQPVQDEPIEW